MILQIRFFTKAILQLEKIHSFFIGDPTAFKFKQLIAYVIWQWSRRMKIASSTPGFQNSYIFRISSNSKSQMDIMPATNTEH